VIVLASTVAEL